MKDYPPGWVVERTNGSFSVKVPMQFGRLEAQGLARISEAVNTLGLREVRASSAQRLMVENVPDHLVDDLVQMIGGVGEPCPYMVTSCPGKGNCKRGLQSTEDMAKRISSELAHFRDLPASVKIGLSGCPRCCGESFVRDIGLMGTVKGWTVIFGGNAGRHVRSGDVLLENASAGKVVSTVQGLLVCYAENGKKRERTARFVERVGIDLVRRSCCF